MSQNALAMNGSRWWWLAELRVLGAYLRHAPEHRGRWRLARRAAALAPALRTSTGVRVIRVRGVGWLAVDGTSQTGRILYAIGVYERGSTELLRRVLRSGDTMIDIGANIGYFSVVAARAVGHGGRVVAFEPQDRVRRRLEQNLRLNHLHNVTVRHEALSSSAGEMDFYAPEADTGLASLRHLDGLGATRVETRTFDELWDGGPVRLVKIDVEGAEEHVLSGMTRCLSTWRPDLLVEVTDTYLRGLGSSARTLFERLTAAGYRMHRIDDDGTLEPIASASALDRLPAQFNAFCHAR